MAEPVATEPVFDPNAWEAAKAIRTRNLALRRAIRALEHHSGRVLEVGAGTGRFLRTLREYRPDLDAYACDFVKDGLSTAHELDPSIHLAQADFTALPYRDETFDIVLVFDVLEHLNDPEQGLRELHRVLAPGGLIHALVPCEGQPATLHWAMWKLNMNSDLKKRHVGHVQRFTHGSLDRMLTEHGFHVESISYSMHPIGQVRDVMMYLEDEPGFPGWVKKNPLFGLVRAGLWGGAYVESTLLGRVPLSAVALHVTATKQ